MSRERDGSDVQLNDGSEGTRSVVGLRGGEEVGGADIGRGGVEGVGREGMVVRIADSRTASSLDSSSSSDSPAFSQALILLILSSNPIPSLTISSQILRDKERGSTTCGTSVVGDWARGLGSSAGGGSPTSGRR